MKPGMEFAMFHKKYNFPNTSGLKASLFNGWQQLKKEILNVYQPYHIKMVFMMEHGQTVFAHNPAMFQSMDPHGWDWGAIGFIYTKRKVKEKTFLKWVNDWCHLMTDGGEGIEG